MAGPPTPLNRARLCDDFVDILLAGVHFLTGHIGVV